MDGPEEFEQLARQADQALRRGDWLAAEAACGRLLQLDGSCVAAIIGLGTVARAKGHLVRSAAYHRRAIEMDPRSGGGYANLANVLDELGDIEGSLAASERAATILPQIAEIASNRLFTLNYHPTLSAAEIFSAYRAWGAARPCPAPILKAPGERIRVGYLSADIRRGSASPLVAPLLRNHDKERFEIFGFSDAAIPDEATAHLSTMCAGWVNAFGVDDESLSRQISDLGIDILVEMNGHTARNRLGMLARKPAPLIVSWLGTGWTTGLAAVDYVITDPWLAPAGTEDIFSERLIRLPTTAYCYEPDPAPPASPLPALATGSLTFGYCGRPVRLNDRVLELWAQLMAAVPGSRLRLDFRCFSDPETAAYFRNRLERHGLPPDRLDLAYSRPVWSAYHAIDVALDPFPHNAGMTSLEALWMGVPLLTMADRAPVGRFGASILTNLGMESWIAASPAEFISKAREISLPDLAALRASLRTAMLNSPLCDGPAFARNVEAAYLQIIDRSLGRNRE